MSSNDDWLDLAQEETLQPDLPICDPHHHLWYHRDPADGYQNPYLLEDLLADTGSGHNVVATVFIECRAMYRADGPPAMRPVGETEFVNGIAAMAASGRFGPSRIAGIIGFADLTLSEAVRAVLEAHIAAGGGRFRGIRHSAGWDANDEIHNSPTSPSPGLMLDAEYRRGFAELAPLGLSFEGWLYHSQLSDLIDLAQAFPDTTIILNHFGGPLGLGSHAGHRQEIFEHWRRDIDALAACPNVFAKLGGINMRINGFHWHEQDRPPTSEQLVQATGHYYRHCIERFGVGRCMFESNFPVDKVSCSYNVLWNAFKRIAAGCSAAEKASLFHDTAVRAYRLAV